MTEPIEARVTVLEETSRQHQRELDTLKAMDEHWYRAFNKATDELHAVKRGVGQLKTDMAGVKEHLGRHDTRFNDIEYLLRDISHRHETRFNEHDTRFDRIDARLDQHDARFDQVDARLDQVDGRFDQVDARFDQVDGRFDAMDHVLQEILHRLPASLAAAPASPEHEEQA